MSTICDPFWLVLKHTHMHWCHWVIESFSDIIYKHWVSSRAFGMSTFNTKNCVCCRHHSYRETLIWTSWVEYFKFLARHQIQTGQYVLLLFLMLISIASDGVIVSPGSLGFFTLSAYFYLLLPWCSLYCWHRVKFKQSTNLAVCYWFVPAGECYRHLQGTGCNGNEGVMVMKCLLLDVFWNDIEQYRW